MEMLFSCPRCTGGAHLASQNRNLGALPKMVDFLISRYFPVPAALVPLWRPKIGIWEPCGKWSIS